MNDILKFLKDEFGMRPIIPLLLILIIASLYKLFRGYPYKELFYDRDFLLISLFILYASITYLIWTSGLAERTLQGRYGIYVARIGGDLDRKVHTKLTESLIATLDTKGRNEGVRIEIRDLKYEITDSELEGIENTASKLNATAIVWGTAIDDNTFYPRLWTRDGFTRSSAPVNVMDISPMADFSSRIWEAVEKVRKSAPNHSLEDKENQIALEVDSLRAELAQLRSLIQLGVAAPKESSGKSLPKLSVLLVGIGDYDGRVNLLSPVNDVQAMMGVLRARYEILQSTILLNKEVTQATLLSAAISTARSTPPEDVFLLYFTGQTSPHNERGVYEFYLSDFQSRVNITDFLSRVLHEHPRSVIIIDGQYDPSKLPSSVVKEAAVFSAAASGNAFEEIKEGKAHGAFTTVFIEAFRKVPFRNPISVGELYDYISFSIQRKYSDTKPGLIVGPNAPTL